MNVDINCETKPIVPASLFMCPFVNLPLLPASPSLFPNTWERGNRGREGAGRDNAGERGGAGER